MENITMKGVNVDILISHVVKQWIRSKKQILDEFGITSSQYEMMSAIDSLKNQTNEIIQINLSETTGIDPMTTSTILRNLEKNNLITRIRGIKNTRVIYIRLTEKGNCIYDMASQKMKLCSDSLYQNIDEQNLTRQLLILSNELRKLNN